MLVMPLDALAALPEEFVAGLESDLQVLLVKRLDFEAAVEKLEPVSLPESWIQAAAAQNITIETTDDLTPEIVGGIASFAPELLDDLTPEMLLVMPVDTLAALPIDYLAELDPTTQVMLAIRLVDADIELDPVPLPDSWIQAGTAQGITLETTADLTPEIITGIAGVAPQMLGELTPIMLLVMPLDTLTALPEEFVVGLDSDVQILLVKRLDVEAAPEELEPVPLPESWIQAAAAQSLTIETTDDLTPEIVEGIASFAPELLDDLTPEMLLVMPVDALIALPTDYMAGLDPALQSQLQERIDGAVRNRRTAGYGRAAACLAGSR
jgi:hypothetical protein